MLDDPPGLFQRRIVIRRLYKGFFTDGIPVGKLVAIDDLVSCHVFQTPN